MNSNSRARLRVAALIYLLVNVVVFGAGLLSVLMTPALVQHAFFWVPAIIVTSFVFSAPLAWFIAPLMMMRFIRAPGSLIQGPSSGKAVERKAIRRTPRGLEPCTVWKH
jgi:hypothetical protein